MALTAMTLADGTPAVGFTCTPAAAATGADITEFGGWRAFLAGIPRDAEVTRSGPPGQIVNTANTMRTTPRNRAERQYS